MGFWYCQWELGFDIANENWVLNSANVSWAFDSQWELGFDVANENWVLNSANVTWAFNIANENWVLMLPMKIGL